MSLTPTPIAAHAALLTTTIESVRDLRWLRGETAALLDRHGVSSSAADDTGLVLSELAVNGFEHGGASLLEVSVGLDERDIVVELLHVGLTDLEIPTSSSMPDPLSLRHRGLAIVDCMARGRETTVEQRGTIVRCFIARS